MVTATICRLCENSAIIDPTVVKSWRIRRIRITNGAPTLTGVRPEASDTKGNCTILITYAGLELGQRRAHFLLQPGDEAVRIE